MQAGAAAAAAPDLLDKIAEHIGIGAFLGWLKGLEDRCSTASSCPEDSADHESSPAQAAAGWSAWPLGFKVLYKVQPVSDLHGRSTCNRSEGFACWFAFITIVCL